MPSQSHRWRAKKKANTTSTSFPDVGEAKVVPAMNSVKFRDRKVVVIRRSWYDRFTEAVANR
jgi:hypothetical protein